MSNVDELIRAAQLEGVSLPIAATIIYGESRGLNIYGHDGVPTGGTYVKGGPVTRNNYLAYRAWMRAGSGRRQGVGPAQCTSAQYQDTADALGGCWVPLANYRSGFRGMGALMRQYGTRGGARRYNGSGPQAEAYADSFMARLATWESRLRGAVVVTPGAAPAPTPPRPKGLPEMIERPLPPGDSSGRLCCPTGSASGLVARAWASVTLDGSARVELWAQRADAGKDVSPGAATKDKAERDWTVRRGDRAWFELPSGTEYLTYRITGASGPGSLLIEQAPK